jgi:flagellar hook-associated protein 3 FlgL
VNYQGDSGERLLQVETSRFMPVNFSGRAFFEAVPNGNGTFVTDAAAGNKGVIENGSVVGTYTPGNYTLTFTAPDTYTLDDGVNPPTTVTGYVSGDPINLGGAQFTIAHPDAGDVYTVNPSTEESMFDTLQKFIATLETGNNNSPDFQNAMNRIGASLDQALQHAVDSRAIVGARMAELDDLKSLGQDLDVQYKTQISDLVDLDYASAISELAKKELQLNAAQQSFVKVTGLSLFNYI